MKTYCEKRCPELFSETDIFLMKMESSKIIICKMYSAVLTMRYMVTYNMTKGGAVKYGTGNVKRKSRQRG